MLKNKLMILLASIAISLFAFTACDEDNGVDPDPDTQPKPSAPSNLRATSIDATTIHLKYDISPSESHPTLWQDYEITWKENGGPTAPQAKVVLKGTNTIVIDGLVEGKIYLFTLVARFTNDSVSAPATILWSPASRFEKNANEETIKVYETASSFGSGLQLFDLGQEFPRVRTIANSSEWDLAVRTVDNKIVFSSATKSGYTFTSGNPQPTFIYKDAFLANSLDEVFDSRAMNDGARNNEYTEQSFDITNLTSSLVFYVRKPVSVGSTSYNYAKVFVKRENGTFLHGTGTNRHLLVEISYQKTPNVPYAKTANDNATN